MGEAQARLFRDAVVYDAPKNIGVRSAASAADVAFVCVPTPMGPDGKADTRAVEEVCSWLEAEVICVRSTVPPGTTDRLRRETGKRVVFQPEYLGETVDHPLRDARTRAFVVLGGEPEDTAEVLRCYQEVYNASVRVHRCSALEAEVTKYMENAFIGVYVTFCNEMFAVCEAFGVDYTTVREGFLCDPRMTPYWTFVYPEERGFGGKCIPKDMAAIVAAATEAGYDPEFLREAIKSNRRFRGD